MKIVSFTRLHYGADYLKWVIQSTQGFSEKHVILYTPTPSFGYTPKVSCPDSYDELRAIADDSDQVVEWVEDVPVHAKTAVDMNADADLILELDADEVVSPSLRNNIYHVANELDAFSYHLPFAHHWRSFGYYCTDSSWPIRIYRPKADNRDHKYWPMGEAYGYVHHFGYARTIKDMIYKIQASAHNDDWRPEWWDEIFMRFPARLTDLHPVCLDGFWNAQEMADADLPGFLRDHPYYDLEIIE